jgi:L-asparaginase
MDDKKIIILGTGGTIAGRAMSATDNIGYTAAQVEVEELVLANPILSGAGNLLTEQVVQIDSKDMSMAVWLQLARRVGHLVNQEDVQGIVITHGTDTLEETAYFLQAVLDPRKPVVLTCGMRPATSLAQDGPQNLMDAIAVASHPRARGVVAVCAGVIHSAIDVQKTHTYRLDAFSSGDAGPIGFVEENKLRLLRNWPLAPVVKVWSAIENVANGGHNIVWPQVEVLMSYAGASGSVVQALLAQGGVQGLVIAATGNGTLHCDLEAVLLNAQSAGIKVVRATRCQNGRVLPKTGDAIPDSNGLSPVKARIRLMLELLG